VTEATATFLSAVRAVQDMIDKGLDPEDMHDMMDMFFPDSSYGCMEDHTGQVCEANVNIYTEDGQCYDLVWHQGQADVRLTKVQL
jgi:hypothetical protein